MLQNRTSLRTPILHKLVFKGRAPRLEECTQSFEGEASLEMSLDSTREEKHFSS